MAKRDALHHNWKNITEFFSRLLASERFLLLVVILYTVMGIAWVLVSDVVLGRLIKCELIANLWLVFVSSGILAVTLWAHTRAVQQKEQSLMESLSFQEIACSIDAELIANKTLKEVLSAVCLGAVNLGHQFCWAGLVKADGRVEVVASHGFSREYLNQFASRWDETSPGMGPVGRAIRSGRTWVFQDAPSHPDYLPWRTAAEQMGFKAVAAIPVVGRKSVLGVLTVYNRKRNSFDQNALFPLELLAQKASLAILTSGQREAFESLNQQHQLILDSVKEGIFGTDLEGHLTFINRAAAEMLGFSPEEILGKEIHPIIHHARTDGEVVSTEECFVCQAICQGEPFVAKEDIFFRKDGTAFPVELESALMKEGNEKVGVVAVFRDLTEEKMIKEQVANLYNYDLATGVFNKRRFKEELKRTLAQTKHFGTPGALLLMEIDGFRAISSTLGQKVTDQLLVELASLLQGSLRETDILGNLGGDEFGIILYGLAQEQVQAWANQLLTTIRKHEFDLSEHRINITASIGIAYFGQETKDVEQVLIQGENALFLAKSQGCNRIAAYSPESSLLDAPWSWKYRLRRALEKEQLILQFQPVVDLYSYQVVGYETLVRLVADDGQVVPAGVFLPWAERYGLVQEIDYWVIRKTVEYIKNNPQIALKKIMLSINISGYTLADQEFRRLLGEVLKDRGFDSRLLIFEITETAAVSNLSEVRNFVDWIRRLGPRFALDDFGAGFSSLNYLKYLPVDFLKIDGSFVKDLNTNPVDQQLVKFMVEVARALNKKTVAEFVDDGRTAKLLREYGVNYAQGYYFGKPGKLRIS